MEQIKYCYSGFLGYLFCVLEGIFNALFNSFFPTSIAGDAYNRSANSSVNTIYCSDDEKITFLKNEYTTPTLKFQALFSILCKKKAEKTLSHLIFRFFYCKIMALDWGC